MHSGLVILTKADAIKMNADVVARKTSWTAL